MAKRCRRERQDIEARLQRQKSREAEASRRGAAAGGQSVCLICREAVPAARAAQHSGECLLALVNYTARNAVALSRRERPALGVDQGFQRANPLLEPEGVPVGNVSETWTARRAATRSRARHTAAPSN
jgi:hypothetical protein